VSALVTWALYVELHCRVGLFDVSTFIFDFYKT
jgi:hypothetical protein